MMKTSTTLSSFCGLDLRNRDVSDLAISEELTINWYNAPDRDKELKVLGKYLKGACVNDKTVFSSDPDINESLAYSLGMDGWAVGVSIQTVPGRHFDPKKDFLSRGYRKYLRITIQRYIISFLFFYGILIIFFPPTFWGLLLIIPLIVVWSQRTSL